MKNPYTISSLIKDVRETPKLIIWLFCNFYTIAFTIFLLVFALVTKIHFKDQDDSLVKIDLKYSSVNDFNNSQIKEYSNIINVAQEINENNVDQRHRSTICGPSTLYVMLNGLLKDKSFRSYVNNLEQKGLFNSGMSDGAIMEAAEDLGLELEKVRWKSRASLAEIAVNNAFKGNKVFAVINSRDSYKAIFKKDNAKLSQEHIVGIVGLKLNENREVIAVGLYDVNAINGFDKHENLNYFIPYKDFVNMLGVGVGGNFIKVIHNPRIFISKPNLNNDV